MLAYKIIIYIECISIIEFNIIIAYLDTFYSIISFVLSCTCDCFILYCNAVTVTVSILKSMTRYNKT